MKIRLEFVFCMGILLLALVVPASAAGPAAAFTGTPVSGNAPLPVSFTDSSTGGPTNWTWYFGDEDYSGSWTLVGNAAWSAREYETSAVMPDGSIVLTSGEDAATGNYLNDVWRSKDNGVTWSLVNASAAWTQRVYSSVAALPDGSLVLTGGSNFVFPTTFDVNDVWRSTDNGSTWTRVNASAGWIARERHKTLALPNGNLVLMGGYNLPLGYRNDTWRSTNNGVTWSLMNASSGWTSRSDFAAVVMPDSSIVLLGGYDSSAISQRNDVWRSTDEGATWTQMNASAGWSPRGVLGAVVLPDNTIIVMGGEVTTPSWLQDVWMSKDYGTTWTLLNAAPGWFGRDVYACAATPNGTVVLMGGAQGTGTGFNDVWSLETTGSQAQNPSHTYANPGTYSVAMAAHNALGTGILQRPGYITVSSAPPGSPTASFTGTPLSGASPLGVTFTDSSDVTAGTMWNWSFGDGAWTNLTVFTSPVVHTYTTAGTYPVSLTVTNISGTNTLTRPAYVSVTSTSPIIVAGVDHSHGPVGDVFVLSGTNTFGDSPSDYSFIYLENATIGGSLPLGGVRPDDFSILAQTGNNATFVQSPVTGGAWTFAWDTSAIPGGTLLQGGLYHLVISNLSMNWSSHTSSSYTRIAIGIEGPITPGLSTTGSTAGVPAHITFIDSSTGFPSTWNLSFGDGSWYNTTAWTNPTHTYTLPTVYHPTLYVQNSLTSTSTTITLSISNPSTGAGGDNSDNGPPSPPVSAGSSGSPGPAPQVTSGGAAVQATQAPSGSQPLINTHNPLSLTYPVGFDGLTYNANGDGQLVLSRAKAKVAGADIVPFLDRLVIYQHHSPGVWITFWGDQFAMNGDSITGPVARADFVTDPFRPNLSFGQVNVSVHSALESLTIPGSVTATVNENLAPDTLNAYQTLAERNKLRFNTVSYTLAIEKENLSRTAPATISMGIPASWILAHGGTDEARIGRISAETGVVELLNTSYTSTDAHGDLTFAGISPNGTSLFGLLTAQATIEEQKAHPNMTYVGLSQSAMVTNAGMFEWLAGIVEANPWLIIAIIAVLAIIAYFGWWKRRL